MTTTEEVISALKASNKRLKKLMDRYSGPMTYQDCVANDERIAKNKEIIKRLEEMLSAESE